MGIKNTPVKNLIYLAVLSLVLVFSLYSLFSDDARSWFVVNKRVTVSPVYGRVLTTGAGRNLASFKNNNNAFEDGEISEEGDGETASLIMVPGDIIHFVFMISVDASLVDDGSWSVDGSTLVLQGLAGDGGLRAQCRIPEGEISIAPVAFSSSTNAETGEETYTYTLSDGVVWQNIANEEVLSFDTSDSSDLEVAVGAGAVETNEEPAVGGAYDGKYIFLLDIPIYYVDSGEDQNGQKYNDKDISDTESRGWMLIERCVFVYAGD